MSEVPSINSNVYPDVPMVTRRRDSVINYGQLSDVRKQNMASRVARVFLLSPSQDRVLLQLRNDSSGNPSAWDCSAEGWVYSTDVSATGECGDYKMAALRETNEELGLVYDSEQMTEIGHYLLDIAGINPAEWTKLYAATYDMGQQDRVKLSDEVSDVKWFNVVDAYDWAQNEPEVFEAGAPLALSYLSQYSAQ